MSERIAFASSAVNRATVNRPAVDGRAITCRDRPAFQSPGGRVGRVFTRPTKVAVAVGLVKTRPTLPTIGRRAIAGKPDDFCRQWTQSVRHTRLHVWN